MGNNSTKAAKETKATTKAIKTTNPTKSVATKPISNKNKTYTREERYYLVICNQCRLMFGNKIYNKTPDELFHLIASYANQFEFQHDHPSNCIKVSDNGLCLTHKGIECASVLFGEYFDLTSDHKDKFQVTFDFNKAQSGFAAIGFATDKFTQLTNVGNHNHGNNFSMVLWNNDSWNMSKQFTYQHNRSLLKKMWGYHPRCCTEFNGNHCEVTVEIDIMRKKAILWNKQHGRYDNDKQSVCVDLPSTEKVIIIISFCGQMEKTVTVSDQCFCC